MAFGCSVSNPPGGSTSQSCSEPTFRCLPSADSSVTEQATLNKETAIAAASGSKKNLLLLIETISLDKAAPLATQRMVYVVRLEQNAPT